VRLTRAAAPGPHEVRFERLQRQAAPRTFPAQRGDGLAEDDAVLLDEVVVADQEGTTSRIDRPRPERMLSPIPPRPME
jgi:hypothetical protein